MAIAAITVLTAVLAVLSLLGTPLQNSVIRLAEADADNFSLQRVNEPDGLAKALVKTIEDRAATPGQLEEILFYDHPSVGWRVRNAMDWKAAHPKSTTVLIDMAPDSYPTTQAPPPAEPVMPTPKPGFQAPQ